MWLLFQSLIIFAVVASNIHWHWTPNGYLAGMLGWIAALLLTVGITNLIDLLRRRRTIGRSQLTIRFRDFWR